MALARARNLFNKRRRFHVESLERREVLAAGPLVISEFLAGNTGDNPTPSSNRADADGAFSDWIEIQNISAAPVDLAGWHLTDNDSDLDQWTFPSRIINAGQYMIVFASGKDRTGAELHTNFKLNSGGEYLALVKPDLTISHEYTPEFPNQDDDISYGLSTETTTTTLVVPAMTGAVHVPTDGALNLTWTGESFDDSGWTHGPLAVGYDTVDPGSGAATDYVFVDFGPAGQQAEPGWRAVGTAPDGANGTSLSATLVQSFPIGAPPTADTFFITLSSVDWRDRGNSTNTGSLIKVGEDHVKNNTGTITMTLASIPAGTYELTSYHIDATLSQSEAILYRVTDAVGTNVLQPGVTGNSSFPGGDAGAPGVNGLTTSIMDSKARTITVVSNGVNQISVTYDSTAAVDKELPLNGFKLRQVQPVQSFGDLIMTDIETAMSGVNTSAYIRAPFEVAAAPNFNTLKLNVRYDDGFIAYLNGNVIASRNAPGSPTWNSSATQDHLYASSRVEEVIDVSSSIGLLHAGTNVLSLHGLNTVGGDSGFFLSPQLEATTVNNLLPRYFSTPTPGAANNQGYIDQVEDTGFHSDSPNYHGAGFYDAPFTVRLTTDTPGAEIRYTTNGSAPTATTGTIYAGTPINITTTTTLRAAAFKPGYSPTNVDTQSYIFLNDVIRQSNTQPGYPTTWGVYFTAPTTPSPVAYYQMDQGIVNDPAYSARIINDLKAIPTMSVVMSIDDLFKNTNSPNGTGGIYSFSKSVDADNANPQLWERPASIEMIYPDGSKEGVQVDAGIQIQGNASREPEKSIKHSFRLLFKEKYGASKFEFPLFDDTPVDKFDAIVLKGGFNNTWMHWDQTQRLHGQLLQDQWASDTQLAMGQPAKHSNYVHLYLNGLYWGLYSPMERPEATFAADYMGGEPEDWDVIDNEATLVDGNMAAWNAMFAIVNQDATITDAEYQQIKQYLDVDNFIDYMIVNFYGANRDWDDHNWYAARRSRVGGVAVSNTSGNPDFGYKFFTFDAERILEGNGDNVVGTNNANRPSGMFQRLKTNAEFTLAFADRAHKHFFNDGALTPTAAAARYAALADKIDEAISGEAARWGDSRNDDPIKHSPVTGTIQTYDRPEWITERDRILNSYMPARSAIMVNPTNGTGQFRSAGLYPTVNAPEFNQHGGRIAAGFDLAISGPAGAAIWYTTNGSDPRLPGGAVAGSAIQWPGGTLDLPETVRVKSRALSGGVWSALTDATFGIDASALRITEIMYNPAPSTTIPATFAPENYEYIELQNTSGSPLDVEGIKLGGEAFSFTFPNVTLSPNQRVVIAKNPAAFAERYPGITPLGYFSGDLDNNGGEVKLTDAAGIIILDFDFKDSWYSITDGEGFSLIKIDPTANNLSYSQKEAWRPSQFFQGNPGSADNGVNPGAIVINEVLANTTNPGGDRIELHNTTASAIDIGLWYLSDDAEVPRKYQIAAGTSIPAGGFITFGEATQFGNAGAPGTLIPFSLSALNGDVLLSSPDPVAPIGGYREDVDFGASAPEVSFGRYVKSTGTTDFVAMSANSLGTANPYPKVGPLVISEFMYHPLFGNDEYIELTNTGATTFSFSEPASPGNAWRFTDGIDFALPTAASLLPGAKALVVPIDPATFRTKYGIPVDVQIFGPYAGNLNNDGERIELSKPGVPVGIVVPYIVVDAVNFSDLAPWPIDTDGTGKSLNRRSQFEYGNDVANWASGTTGGTPGVGDPLLNASLLGRAFNDTDADGIQDAGEAGRAGATISLYYRRTDGSIGTTTDVLAGTQVTTGSGDYSFAGLPQGNYYIQAIPNDGDTISPVNAGADDAIDSDVNPLTGKSNVFALTAGQVETSIDVGSFVPVGTGVVGRFVFYNQSKFDGNDATAGPSDDAAIATDKTPLLPGGTSTFANYTSFNRGLNGIMVDIAELPAGPITAGDFSFKVGNSNTPADWTPLAAAPTVTVRAGAGVGGSSRVTLIWPTGAAIKQWLQVTVKVTGNTGLTTPDVFYFGNAVGESGNVAGDYSVSITDELLARNNPVGINPGATAINRFDYNRDGTVSVVDQLLSRNNITTAATRLRQITVPSALQASGLAAQSLHAPDSASSNSTGSSAPVSAASSPLLRPQAISAAFDRLAVDASSAKARLSGSALQAEVDNDLLELITRK